MLRPSPAIAQRCGSVPQAGGPHPVDVPVLVVQLLGPQPIPVRSVVAIVPVLSARTTANRSSVSVVNAYHVSTYPASTT